VDDDGQATDREINQLPRVATVQMIRPTLAARTASRPITALNNQVNQTINQRGVLDGHLLEVRQ